MIEFFRYIVPGWVNLFRLVLNSFPEFVSNLIIAIIFLASPQSGDGVIPMHQHIHKFVVHILVRIGFNMFTKVLQICSIIVKICIILVTSYEFVESKLKYLANLSLSIIISVQYYKTSWSLYDAKESNETFSLGLSAPYAGQETLTCLVSNTSLIQLCYVP